jgi:hypothetical protein
MGVVIIVFAAVALLFVVVTAALAGSLPILPGNATGALVGLGLLRMQYPDYSQALARGARAERWWPPLVVVIGATLVSGALGR